MLRNRTRKKVAKLKAEEEEARKPKTVPHWKRHLQNEKELQDTATRKVSFVVSKDSLNDTELPDVIKKGPDLTDVWDTNKREVNDLSNKFIQEIKEHDHSGIVELDNIELYTIERESYENAKDILSYNIII